MKMVRITNTFNNRLAAKNIFAIYKNELNIKWILEKNDENKQVPVCGFKKQTNEISKKKKDIYYYTFETDFMFAESIWLRDCFNFQRNLGMNLCYLT